MTTAPEPATPEPLSAHQRALQRWFPHLPDNGTGDWRTQALCTKSDGDRWFPDPGGTATPAKTICNQCPVQTQCLDQALTNNENFGIWGGLTPTERHHLKRSPKPPNQCRNGHTLTDDNTRITASGIRRCRLCQNEAARKAKARKREEQG